MRNVADITDNWGAGITVNVVPGIDCLHPQLVQIIVTDRRPAAVELTREQADALIKALTDAIG